MDRSVVRTPGLAWLLWLATALLASICALAGVLFGQVVSQFMDEGVGIAMFATIGVVALGYASAGLLILRHRPRHAVGWLLMVGGMLLGGEFAALLVGAQLALARDPLAAWLLALASVGFWPTVMLAGPAIALLFPDGRLPGPRWRLPVAIGGSIFAAALLVLLVRPGPLTIELAGYTPNNPLGLAFVPSFIFDLVDATGALAIPLTVVGAIAGIVVRFRRASADERRQLKWFTVAALLWAALLVAQLVLGLPDEVAVVVFACLLLLPGSILIAISRYRLYEIDTLINRALVYVPLVGIVAGLYAASVALFQRFFVALTGNTSDAAAIISALLLAAVFTPIRNWLQGLVDRRFKPAPSSAASAESTSTAGTILDDPAFEQKVEGIVRRVIRDEAARRRRVRD